MENKQLCHHGTKGMKWGVRRFQNKDGTLTAAGKKRYASELKKVRAEEKVAKNKQATKAKVDALETRRKVAKDQQDEADLRKSSKVKAKSDAPDKPKDIKDMSDKELQAAITRLRLEQDYKNLSSSDVKKGKSFIEKVGSDVIAPAATDVGKQLVKSAMTASVNAVIKDMTKNGGEQLFNEYKIYTNNKK